MNIVCFDFEGVLVPDIWPHVAQRTGISDLKLTTRDVKDYRELMEHRVKICHENNISLKDIQEYIAELRPYKGALELLRWIRSQYQFILLSDTFYQFVPHFMKILEYPTLFCHSISYNGKTKKLEFHLRLDNQKAAAVRSLKAQNFRVFASGDSYNDITMLQEADEAAFYNAPDSVLTDFPGYKSLKTYADLKNAIANCFD